MEKEKIFRAGLEQVLTAKFQQKHLTGWFRRQEIGMEVREEFRREKPRTRTRRNCYAHAPNACRSPFRAAAPSPEPRTTRFHQATPSSTPRSGWKPSCRILRPRRHL